MSITDEMTTLKNKIIGKVVPLRELCRREYDDEFVKLYDLIGQGIPIGGLYETIIFLEMIEEVKIKYGMVKP